MTIKDPTGLSRLATRKLVGGIPADAIGSDAPPQKTRLSTIRAGAVRGELAKIHGLGEVWIQLLSGEMMSEVESATYKRMAALGIDLLPINATHFDMDRTARMMAIACRDPEDPTHLTRFATEREWLNEDWDMLMLAKLAYDDVRRRLDPTQPELLMDPDTRAAIDELVKKKEPIPLLQCGVVTLTSYLLSGGAQPESSPMPASENGDSLPESSSL